MSQPMGMSSARTALAVGTIALVLGAAALGYTVYLGLSQVPTQLSSLAVNRPPTTMNITIEWVLYQSDRDRFSPEIITIVQGDTINLNFISNDTADGHTFTLKLLTGVFQLNDSMAGQLNVLTNTNFAGNATGNNGNCMRDGVQVACNTSIGACLDGGGNEIACDNPNAVTSQISSSGSFTVRTSDIYGFRCLYHESLGMVGFLVVVPNKGFTG